MMQIHKFPVATMSKEKLLERLQTVDRWKNVFEIQQNQVRLRNFSDVENIIRFFLLKDIQNLRLLDKSMIHLLKIRQNLLVNRVL